MRKSEVMKDMKIFQARVRDGEALLGFAMSFPSPGVIEMIGAGWDWVWLDSQHGQLDYADLIACVRACEACGIGSIVRVPSHEAGAIGRALDMGASGVMVPMVDTAEQAQRLVEAVRFPPLGCRSFGGRRVYDVWGPGYAHEEGRAGALVVQIETPEAVANAEAIAAVEGVDVLFVGADDLKLRLEIPMGTPALESKEVMQALEKTGVAAKKAGKMAGCVAFDRDTLQLVLRYGHRLVAGGSDAYFLRTAAAERRQDLRDVME